jgi:hypothetical protein
MNLTKIAAALDLIADHWPPSTPSVEAPADDVQLALQSSLGERYTPDLGEKIAADPDLKDLILSKVAAAEPQTPRPFGVPVERPDVRSVPQGKAASVADALSQWGDDLFELSATTRR